jgi:serine/threonine protein kinase
MTKNTDPTLEYKLLCKASQDSNVGARLRFFDKEYVAGGCGFIVREGYIDNGNNVLRKVEKIASSVTSFLNGIRSIENYILDGDSLVADGNQYQLKEDDARRLRFALHQVEVLGYILQCDSQERFPKLVCSLDTGKKEELFFAQGNLYHTFLMTEKKGVSLSDLNRKFHTVAESDLNHMAPLDLVKMAYDLGSDLLLLQQWGVVHRDIKRGNILREVKIPGKSNFSLLDFGVAYFAGEVEEYNSKGSKVLVGTFGHQAPELLLGKDATFASDAYALGVVLYAELTGQKLPFSGIKKRIITQEDINYLNSRLYRDSPFRSNFLDAVVLLLDGIPERRDISGIVNEAKYILSHPEQLYRSCESNVDLRKKEEFAQTNVLPRINGSKRISGVTRAEQIEETFSRGACGGGVGG